MPKNPTPAFMRSFAIWCLAELLKTSTMIWDYVDLGTLAPTKAAPILWASYSQNSSLWKAYKAQMTRQAKRRQWNVPQLLAAFEFASTTDACASLLMDVVPNSKVLTNSYPPQLSLYVGHH
jgi:hypothetical protein